MRWLRTEQDGENVGLSPLSVENGCGTEVAEAASQTKKRNNSKQNTPINPEKQTKVTNKGQDHGGLVRLRGWNWPVMDRPGNLKFITLKNSSYL